MAGSQPNALQRINHTLARLGHAALDALPERSPEAEQSLDRQRAAFRRRH